MRNTEGGKDSEHESKKQSGLSLYIIFQQSPSCTTDDHLHTCGWDAEEEAEDAWCLRASSSSSHWLRWLRSWLSRNLTPTEGEMEQEDRVYPPRINHSIKTTGMSRWWQTTDWLVGHSYGVVGVSQVLSPQLHHRVLGHVHLLHQRVLSEQTQKIDIRLMWIFFRPMFIPILGIITDIHILK